MNVAVMTDLRRKLRKHHEPKGNPADPYCDYCYDGNCDVWLLLNLIDEYRQTFLDIATEAGGDTSGLDHPDQLVTPDINEYALRAVRTLRQSYDEAVA